MGEKKTSPPSIGRIILLQSVPLKYMYCLNNFQQVTDYTVMKKKKKKKKVMISLLPPFWEKAGLSNSNSGMVNDAESDLTTCLFKSC